MNEPLVDSLNKAKKLKKPKRNKENEELDNEEVIDALIKKKIY